MFEQIVIEFEDMEIGYCVEVVRVVIEEDLELFVKVFGDYNLVYMDEEFVCKMFFWG